MLVCDANGPTGLAGIMGGATSEVSDSTTRVAMEAATWNGTNILQTSKKLGLRSEASTRFEKQLHPRLALQAQRLAARLMVELCGARMVPGTIDVAAPEPEPHRITLRSARLQGLLGERIEPAESQAILERLGFGVEPLRWRPRGGGALLAPLRRVPRGRRDRGGRARARPRPAARHAARTARGGRRPDPRRSACAARSRTTCAAAGLSEAVNFSFISPDAVRCLRLDEDATRGRVLPLANPLSEDQSVMRTSLLPGLLEVARHNVARDIEDLRLFETGRVFYSKGPYELPDERLHLAIVLSGDFAAGAPGGGSRCRPTSTW